MATNLWAMHQCAVEDEVPSKETPRFLVLNRRIILKQCGSTQATLKDSTIYHLSDYTTTNMKLAGQCDELQRRRGATRLASCVNGGSPAGLKPIKVVVLRHILAVQWHGRMRWKASRCDGAGARDRYKAIGSRAPPTMSKADVSKETLSDEEIASLCSNSLWHRPAP